MDKRKLTYVEPHDPWFRKAMISGIEFLSGRVYLENEYNRILHADPPGDQLWQMMVDALRLNLRYDEKKIQAVADESRLIFIANHPFGVIDGIIMGYLVSRIRQEFKFLVNSALCKEEKLNQFLLPIDFRNTKEAMQINLATREKSLHHISEGLPILIFPSGGVATAPKAWKKAEDLEWKKFVVKLIKKSGATVLPIFFPGQNSRLFQIVSQFSMDMRLGLLLHEVHNKMGRTIEVRIGDPIRSDELPDKKKILEYLRAKVFEMA